MEDNKDFNKIQRLNILNCKRIEKLSARVALLHEAYNENTKSVNRCLEKVQANQVGYGVFTLISVIMSAVAIVMNLSK